MPIKSTTTMSSKRVKPPVQALFAKLSTFRFKQLTSNAGAAVMQNTPHLGILPTFYAL